MAITLHYCFAASLGYCTTALTLISTPRILNPKDATAHAGLEAATQLESTPSLRNLDGGEEMFAGKANT